DRVLACRDRLSHGDWDAFERTCLAPRVIARIMDGATADTTAAAHAMFAALRHQFPDLRASPQLVLVAGRPAFVQSIVTGTDAPTHRAIAIYAVEHLTFDDSDRIVEDDVYADPTAVMAQLSALPEEAEFRVAVWSERVGAPEVVVASGNALETG